MLNYVSFFKKISFFTAIVLCCCITSATVQAASVTQQDIPALFKSVYDRNASEAEKKYWISRIKDKPEVEALKGAMAFQRAHGRVLGTKSNNLYKMELKDNTTTSASGELVTYSVKVTNIYPENTVLTPQLSIKAKDLEITAVSDHGRREKLANGKPGGAVDWNYITSQNQKNRYEVKVDTKKSHTFTFQIKTPSALGSEYCIEANLFPFLQDKDCNTVVKSTKKQAAPTPTPRPVAKVSEKDFRITAPDSLNTDRADQQIHWDVSDKIAKQYPNAKLELCPGKDFKNCVILEAVIENDGSQTINMPPVPRIGKWYLHLIGRDSEDRLFTNVTASRLITLHK